eukprot:2850734-Pyramimonas_sp.AAC.2
MLYRYNVSKNRPTSKCDDCPKLQACPKKIVYQAMTLTGKVDLHSNSGYRRLNGDANDHVKGYGIRGQSCYDVETRLPVNLSLT